MNKFETLLLKTGNPDLICEFINVYKSSLSDDFMQNFAVYRGQIDAKLAKVVQTKAHFEPSTMPIGEFLEMYGSSELTKTIRTRIEKALHFMDIMTVQELLECTREDIARRRNVGLKSVLQLERLLAKVGCSLKN